jgi:hypothetical protein
MATEHKAGKSPPRRTRAPKEPATGKWSAKVTETSDAMDLEKDVFKSRSPEHIAASEKRSAERSHRGKSSPFRSAMSMLTFYINRGGKPVVIAQTRAGGPCSESDVENGGADPHLTPGEK